MKTFLPPVLLILLLLSGGCATISARPDAGTMHNTIPGTTNPNTGELAAFIQTYSNGTEEAHAARFLHDNLPLADRLSMTARDLRENLEYAFLARRTMPWGTRVPWDHFLHYVLPHRTSQEPFQPHRETLFRELAPLCSTAGSMEEALSRVGAWCAARAEYRPTSRRDLGVRSILEGGYGRCEETNILFMAAARAVGLPVRQATVPWWQHANGNHAWVEAWTDEGWHFLETGTEFHALNKTWFAAQTPRMPKVVAYVYGHPDDPRVYRTGPGFALADSTANYTQIASLRVVVTSSDGTPVPGHDVYFSVFSLGGLRPVTRTVTNEFGVATADLGPGTFFVSCAASNGLSWSMRRIQDGETDHLQLSSDVPSPLPERLDFNFPEQAADTFRPEIRPELTAIRAQRSARWEHLLVRLDQPLRERLSQAGELTPQWLRLLDGSRPASWTAPLIQILDDKDMLQANPEYIPEDIVLALRARTLCQEQGLTYPDEIFLNYVLSPRIHLEPWSPWRKELWPGLEETMPMSFHDKIDLIRKRVDHLQTLPPALFGPPPTPGQTLTSGFCTQPVDKAIVATAALRTLGIPARLVPDFGGLEYFNGQTWTFWKIGDPSDALSVLLLKGSTLKPLLNFGVSRVEKGQLRVLDDLPWEETPDGLKCTLPAGAYQLVTADRSGNFVTIALRPFTVEPEIPTIIDMTESSP